MPIHIFHISQMLDENSLIRKTSQQITFIYSFITKKKSITRVIIYIHVFDKRLYSLGFLVGTFFVNYNQ
jgi:hypothetical protein